MYSYLLNESLKSVLNLKKILKKNDSYISYLKSYVFFSVLNVFVRLYSKRYILQLLDTKTRYIVINAYLLAPN